MRSFTQSERLGAGRGGIPQFSESFRGTVHDAESLDSLARQITILQTRLNESTEENASLKKQLAAATQKSESSAKKLTELHATVSDLTTQMETLREKCAKLKMEKVELLSQCQQLQAAHDEAVTHAEQLRAKLKKMKKRESAMQECFEQAETRVNQVDLESQKVMSDNKNLRQEIEDLKLELESATASNSDLVKANQALRSESRRVMSAFSALEEQIKAQSGEIVECHKERHAITEMLRKMYAHICTSESLNDKLQAELDEMMVKMKGKMMSKGEQGQIDLSSIEMPFSGTLGSQCRQIMNMTQFTVVQRIQRILNIIASELAQVERLGTEKDERITVLTKSLEAQNANSEKSEGALRALLRELKNLAVTEANIDTHAFCDADQGFLQFVAEKCVAGAESAGSASIPSDFFSLDDINRRKAVIERQIGRESDAFALFTAQFLANTILRKQLQKALSGLAKKEELNVILNKLQCSDFHEILGYVEQMQDEITQLQRENRSLAKLYKNMKKSEPVHDDNVIVEMQSIQTRNDELQNEIRILELRNQVLNQKIQEIQTESAKEPISRTDPRVPELESLVLSKDREMESLKQASERAQIENKRVVEKMTIKYSRREQLLLSEIESLKTKIAGFEVKIAKNAKRHRKEIKEITRKNELQRDEITVEYQQAKLSYDEAMQRMEEKMASTRELSQKLLKTVSDKERANQKLSEEIAKLRLSLKSMDMKLTKTQEESQKERQVLQGQISATKLSCQSQLQDYDRLMKKEADARVKVLYDDTLRCLGEFYRIDTFTMDDESFRYLLSLVKRDLSRLQLFQNQGMTSSCITNTS